MKYYIKRLINTLLVRLFVLLHRREFRFFGGKSYIFKPLKIQGKENIIIESSVKIHHYTWLAALPIEEGNECVLYIGEGSVIGHFNHIYATQSIKIGKNVLTADKVYISDNLHSYEDIRIPIMFQRVKQICSVEIGDGSWLGENVCVIGAKIGKNCVIGANSVVTRDIPDYSVAVGAPAKIIKRFNQIEQRWVVTHADGSFRV